MPWLPELFSTRIVERYLADTADERPLIPYFAGLAADDTDALIGSFIGEPELHHPIRGRIKGAPAFERYVTESMSWVRERNVTVEDVALLITPHRTIEEVVLHFDDQAGGRVEAPVAIAADRDDDCRLYELRMYQSSWPLTGTHAIRSPVLQRDPGLHEDGVVGDYQRALAAGDVEATLEAFEPDASVREPAGSDYVHRGDDELRALFTLFFSNGGGIPLQHCAVTDDGRSCALEYNVVEWGRTPLSPQAGIAVYVRGDSGKLAAARIYDDVDPPLGGG